MMTVPLNIVTYLTEEDLEDIIPKDLVMWKFIFFCYGLIGLGVAYYRMMQI